MYEAVRCGYCPPTLLSKYPGNITHVRWLITGNRLWKLYILTEVSSENLLEIVDFCIEVYVPWWLTINISPSCSSGSKLIFRCLQLIRSCLKRTQEIVKPVIQRNSFFTHPANIIFSMIDDEDFQRKKSFGPNFESSPKGKVRSAIIFSPSSQFWS